MVLAGVLIGKDAMHDSRSDHNFASLGLASTLRPRGRPRKPPEKQPVNQHCSFDQTLRDGWDLLLLWYAVKTPSLFPTEEMERQLALNRAEVCVIGRDHTGADTSCRQGDQYIKGQLT